MTDEIFRKPLVDAFDAVLGPVRSRFRQQGQRDREQALAKADRRQFDEDRIRKGAEIALMNGDPDAMRYVQTGPTPEQLGKGFFERYVSKLDNQHDQRVNTVRRVLVPHVIRLYHAGFIDSEQLSACRWYRDTYEATGLIGNIASSDYAREVFSAPQSRSMFTDWQVECQTVIRFIRGSLTAKYTAFFDAIVLHDIAPQKALRLAKKRNGAEGRLFAEMADELAVCYSELKR